MNNSRASFIQNLHDKKNRKKQGLFLVEGEKSILELIKGDYIIRELILSHKTWNAHKEALLPFKQKIELVEPGELAKISTLEMNDTGIAVVQQKENEGFEIQKGNIVLALDDIRDPGNLGTIIRTADWYGITKIICSIGSADIYNPKAISASMGSFTRVQVWYTNIDVILEETKLPILGGVLDGKNVHAFPFPNEGILVIGNEANGIKNENMKLIKHKISIPRYGETESMNAAIATGIILDNWKRTI